MVSRSSGRKFRSLLVACAAMAVCTAAMLACPRRPSPAPAAAAYLRIEAAVGVEDWDVVVEDAREESELELEIDEADQDCLGPFRIGAIPNGGDPDLSAGGLDKRFVMSSSVRRCH